MRIAAVELDAHLRELPDAQPVESIEMAEPVFFRGKGAYLVGRLRRGRHTTPVCLALVHERGGVVLDAILFTEDDLSIVFSFTRSYFLVDAERPQDLVAFLSALMPRKRWSELYTALGFDKHGKTELYREIVRHLESSSDAFVPARGDRGMVMSVFTLPGLDVVFKVIRDRFRPPKQTSRQEVMDRYRHVFQHDRAGRLVDAQEFEQLAFPRGRFSPEVLAELRRRVRRRREGARGPASPSGTSTPSAGSRRSTCSCASRTSGPPGGRCSTSARRCATSPPPARSPATCSPRTSG